ncbi:MAG: PQQ-binding-like beta-propeller repeat protein, partial [Planctomycetaceae bacterium]
IDKSSLQTVSVWPMPNRFSVPMPGGSAFQGHFFPIGLPGELRGYSLLEMAEREPVWRRRPPEIAKLNATPSIGPGGPEFVVFQIRNHLIVCDPSDGAVLWQRSDLPADSGMYADPAAGISGDESCLTVFEQDRVKYTVYDTFSGRVLRRGELENESRPPRRPFGRKLHCVWQVRGQWEARVWDPLANRWEFVEPLAERNYLAQQVIGSGELMWLTADARLKAYDVQNSRETLNATFQAEDLEGLSALRVVNDGPRTYVNIQRHSPPVQTRDYNNAFRDVPVAGLTIRDDLYAIDRETQRVLWKRTVPFRTLLKLEPAGLPFLVLLSQIRDARENNPLSLLVEVIDADTGDLIARRDKLPLDPSAPIIRHAEYDGVDQKVRVLFQRMTVEIELSPHASPFHAPTE